MNFIDLMIWIFSGAVSLEYPLSQQPVYGQNWTIRVVAQGQVEEKQFAVEEYCMCCYVILCYAILCYAILCYVVMSFHFHVQV